MSERICPGLPADWLNAWLAAVGATTMVDGMCLRWSDDPTPVAILSSPSDRPIDGELGEALAAMGDVLAVSPLAERPGEPRVPQNLERSQFENLADRHRASGLSWHISSLYTDLVRDEKQSTRVVKGPFLFGAQGGDPPLNRLRALVPDAVGLSDALDGTGQRIEAKGFGLDVTRIGSQSDKSDVRVDPVIELLGFNGLALLPVRGRDKTIVQRGWKTPYKERGSFRWMTWSVPLDRFGIDALLDIDLDRSTKRRLASVTSRWESVLYPGSGGNDVNRGYASRRVDE